MLTYDTQPDLALLEDPFDNLLFCAGGSADHLCAGFRPNLLEGPVLKEALVLQIICRSPFLPILAAHGVAEVLGWLVHIEPCGNANR
jgi:hypothetical protein